MKNRTDFVGVGVRDQTRQAALTHSHLLEPALWGLGGLFFALGSLLQEISPFGTALCAVCPRRQVVPTALGAAAGSLLAGVLLPRGASFSMRYVAAVFIVAVLRWALDPTPLARHTLPLGPLLASGSLLLPSLAVALAGPSPLFDGVLAVCESVLAGATAYFFGRSLHSFRLGQGLLTAKRSDAACLGASVCIFLISLSSVTLASISPGRALGSFAVMLCALLGGVPLGSAAGALCGCSVALALFPRMSLLGAFAFGGLIAGVFSPLGKAGVVFAYLLASTAINLLSGGSPSTVPMLIESLASGAALLLLPPSAMRFLRGKVFRTLDRGSDKGLRDLLLARMADAAAALKDIALTTRQVSQKLGEMQAADIGQVYHGAIDAVCRSCSFRSRCWQQEYTDCMGVFNNLTDTLRQEGQVTEEMLGYPLSARCRRKGQLVERINTGYQEFRVREGLSRKVARVRSVVTDQFEGMADMLSGFAGELAAVDGFDNRLTLKVSDYLDQEGIPARNINCYRDQQERLFLQLYLSPHKLARLDRAQTAQALSQLCGCLIDLPEETTLLLPPGALSDGEEQSQEVVRLTFREKAAFTMEFASCQHTCQGSRLCGDACTTFIDRSSVAHLILSDGMGSGTAAAVDSAMTVSLLSKLIGADVGYDPSLKIVNSALLVKSGEESLSTIDMTAVNLYTGQADFYKAGAAPTFLKRGGKAGYVESTSFPVGILTDAAFEHSRLRLEAGDLVVMVSDGATASGTDWVRTLIEQFPENGSLQDLCDDIASTARLRRNDSHDDDITVLAGRLTASTSTIE